MLDALYVRKIPFASLRIHSKEDLGDILSLSTLEKQNTALPDITVEGFLDDVYEVVYAIYADYNSAAVLFEQLRLDIGPLPRVVEAVSLESGGIVPSYQTADEIQPSIEDFWANQEYTYLLRILQALRSVGVIHYDLPEEIGAIYEFTSVVITPRILELLIRNSDYESFLLQAKRLSLEEIWKGR